MKEWDFSPRWLTYFFLLNRVEDQKLKQTTAPFGWVLMFNSAFGRYGHWLVLPITSPSYMVRQLVLFCSCVCRRKSWIPETQPNGGFAFVWFSFWCLTWFTRKKYLSQRGEKCWYNSLIFFYVVYGQPLSGDHSRVLKRPLQLQIVGLSQPPTSRNLRETTEVMGFMRSFFHNYRSRHLGKRRSLRCTKTPPPTQIF